MENLPDSRFILGKNKTPPLTNTNANKVPMLVRSVINLSSITKTNPPTRTPDIIVEKLGVLYFLLILPNALGNKPSRLIAIQIRGCPS